MRDAAFPSVAIGFFDGLHLGHRKILAGAERVITFRNHPLTVLNPSIAPRLIMSCAQRVDALHRLGIKHVDLLDFTPSLATLSPEDFLSSMRLTPQVEIRCGENGRFGKGGEGSGAWLAAHGYRVTVVPMAIFRGQPISSSRIRQTLERGEIAEANEMLGHPLEILGKRFAGKGEGHRLGFPTLNFHLPDLALHLPLGVYIVTLGGVRALANYGRAPTFGVHAWPEPVLEVHFVGGMPANGPILDSSAGSVPIAFESFVRPERTFSTPVALAHQISIDCASLKSDVAKPIVEV